jgi:hypothetical protein
MQPAAGGRAVRINNKKSIEEAPMRFRPPHQRVPDKDWAWQLWFT